MIFTSYIFLFFFLPLSLLVYLLCPHKYRNPSLLFVSYIFYGYWRLDFLALLIGVTIVHFFCAQKISISVDPAVRRLYLVFSIVISLGILGYFKYFVFAISNLNKVLYLLGRNELPLASIILPVGISFFTFQTVSYTIDVYRNKSKASKNFVDFAC